MTNGEKYKTARERAEAFCEFCKMECDNCKCNKMNGGICNETPYEGTFAWLDLEAEEEKPLPCPFCGEDCADEKLNGAFVVMCYTCTYRGRLFESKQEAIAAHNRVAKAAKESEAK